MTSEELLRTMYDGFNARDIDGVLAAMTEDVDWPNAWEGGRPVGHEQVRDYWTRQWAAIDPHVEPPGFEPAGRRADRGGGAATVSATSTARSSPAGNAVSHVYEIR